MEPHPPSAPLPPFWAAVRRCRPDVDIVLLPAEHPPPLGEQVDGQAVHSAAERVDAAVVALGGRPGAVRLGFGPDPGTVVPRARVVGHREDGPATLGTVRGRLVEQGWSVRSPEGGVARLVGRRGDLVVRASYAEATGTFLLDVSTDPLVVGDARARELASR